MCRDRGGCRRRLASTEPPAAASGADPRRTPAVEIFQRYKDAVVYLTGPMANPREPAVEEFFVLSPDVW